MGGKTVNIAFELSNISKQIARKDFLTTHMANLPTFTFILLFIAFCGAGSSMIKALFFVKSSVTLKALGHEDISILDLILDEVVTFII